MWNDFIANLGLTGLYYFVCIAYIAITAYLTVKGTYFNDIEEILKGNVAVSIHLGCKLIAVGILSGSCSLVISILVTTCIS